MIETQYRRIELFDNVQEYLDRVRARRNWLMGLMLTLLTLAMGVIVAIRFLAPGALTISPLLALAVMLFAALPIAIWNNPRVGLYTLALCMCLFLQMPATLDRDPFAAVPLFWNISTTWEHYANGSHALEFLHMNLGEVIMVMTALFWLMRQITMRQLRFNPGAFFGWLSLYLAWCCIGFFHGTGNGGDITTALWELRAQGYFVLAYLLVTNLVTDRKHAITLLWLLLLGIGAKSIVGTINYIKDPNVTPDQGVLSHEDSLLLNIILFGALLFSLSKTDPKLRWGFLLFLPTTLAASMANGRRAGIASFIVAFPVVIILCMVLLRERRKALTIFMAIFTVAAAVYLPIAWNGEGAWALPARAIRSQTDPSDRDASSDSYRVAEDANLKLTRDSSPWLGFGYGRAYIVAFAQPGRNDPFENILPHDGILWIWMRLGHIGFTVFWMFVAIVLVRGPNLLRAIRDPRLQVIGILGIATFLMLIMYGQYDLAFANYRSMWISGTMVGLLAVLPRLVELKQQERTALGKSFASQDRDDDLDVREVSEDESEEMGRASRRRRLPGQKRGTDESMRVDW